MKSILNKTYTLRLRLIGHVFLWLTVGLLYLMTYNRLDPNLAWILMLKDLITVMTIFYLFGHYMIPKFILGKKKKHLWYSIFMAPIVYLFWASNTYLTCHIIHRYFQPNQWLSVFCEMVLDMGILGFFQPNILPAFSLDFIYCIAFPLGLKMVHITMQENHRRVELERDNLLLELGFLKSQVNPHFLFNTLNSMYALVRRNDPNAPEVILNLSGLLHYTLYECDEQLVLLSSELEFIDHYLKLQRLRYGQEVAIIKEYDLRDDDPFIVPLVFFNFLENAFKHGPDKSLDNAWVHLSISCLEGRLMVHVGNSSPDLTASLNGKAPMAQSGGIGQKNAIKRLNLHYPDRHTIKLKKLTESYHVYLNIEL